MLVPIILPSLRLDRTLLYYIYAQSTVGLKKMASNTVRTVKKRCLKKGHHLIGRDLLPVIKMLQDFEASGEEMEEGDFWMLKVNHPLSNYTLEELRREFRALTGNEVGHLSNDSM